MTLRSWRGHSIGHNKRSRRPSLFCFVDTETIARPQKPDCTYVENELRCGVACFVEWRKGRKLKESWWDFDKADGFWVRLLAMLQPHRVCWLVAHNCLFDSTVLGLWELLEHNRLFTSAKEYAKVQGNLVDQHVKPNWQGLIAIDGLPFHMELLHENGRLNVSDLQNYYPCSLESIGESVGIPKMDMPALDATGESWLTYCKQDVEILKTAYLNLVKRWEREDNGNWKMSAAGLAWNNYRHTRDCSDIIIHQHGNARDLEWDAYYGGECRAWYRGQCRDRVVHLDVNSLYPSVMANNEYPIELVDYILTPHLGIVESLVERYSVIADITMENIWDDIPTRHNGRIVYPVGTFRTQLAAPEFASCLKGNCIHQIHAIAYYKRAAIFNDYVQRWYGVKSNASEVGDSAGELLAKLMLNSLNGKFAQRSKVWESDPDVECLRPWSVWPHKDQETGRVFSARSIGWNAQVAKNLRQCSHSFPAIAATITSYARQKMQHIRQDIPPSCLYYQDTDSLLVDREWFYDDGRWQLPMGKGLGQLRIVGEYAKLEIRGPKNYTADGRHCISGVRRKDRKEGAYTFIGSRMERTASIVTRPPDGTVRSWERIFDVPGTCREAGYNAEGWYIPMALGLTKTASVARLTT
jgi:hypothetical protein